MTQIFKFIFFLYQGLTSSSNATCRFRPTCSQYAVQSIEKYGLIKGVAKSAGRLLSCHPLTKRPIYDPA